MTREFTNKEIEQIKQDLSRKNIKLEIIEYYKKPLGDDETYIIAYANELYQIILRSGNNRWYEKRYTTKKDSKKHKNLVVSNAVDYKLIKVNA